MRPSSTRKTPPQRKKTQSLIGTRRRASTNAPLAELSCRSCFASSLHFLPSRSRIGTVHAPTAGPERGTRARPLALRANSGRAASAHSRATAAAQTWPARDTS
eukprot:5757687-Heterocapsa_arctica.AAC.1